MQFNKSSIIRLDNLISDLFHFDDCWSHDNWFINNLLEVNDADGDVDDRNDCHSFQSWVHRLHEDVEVTVVLWPTFDVSLHVESVRGFYIDITGWGAVADLVRSTHFEEATTGIIITVVDSLDNSLDLWSLDQIEYLKFNGNLKGVSARVVFLKHDGSEEVLIINGLNILDDHGFDLVRQLSARITQTEELLGQQEQELVEQTHVQQRVGSVREYVSLQSVVENLEVHDAQELLHTIEIEDWKQTLGEEQLSLQEFVWILVTEHVGVNGFLDVLEDLFFESVSQIKNDIVGIGFDSECEEINLEFDAWLGQILKSQSELSAHDEDLDGLCGNEELSVRFKKMHDVAVRKDHTIELIGIFSLVVNQYRYEVDQLNHGLLVVVYLRSLDLDEFVTYILSDVEHDLILQHVLDHLVILRLEQHQHILSRNLEIGIVRNGDFELCVFG